MCLFSPKAPKRIKPPTPVAAPKPPQKPAKVTRARPTRGGKNKSRLRGTARSDLKVSASPSGVNAATGGGGVYTPYA
jgi:hypothetical protein